MEKNINWYPGHMARTRRLLEEQIRKVDLVIELCDARLPHSSRNPELIRLAGRKAHVLLLNKADLANQEQTKVWTSFFRSHGLRVFSLNTRQIHPKELEKILAQTVKEVAERAEDRGFHKTMRAMVVGVPNVGKSTLINKLYGGKITQTGDRPGVTKSNQWVKIHEYLEIMDSPGLLWPRLDDQLAARRLCYLGTLRDEIIDLESLAMHLLDDLADLTPETLISRFHVRDASLRGIELLDQACLGRGWLMRGNQLDYDRGSKIILDEFREGKLGRITLETPASFAEAGI